MVTKKNLAAQVSSLSRQGEGSKNSTIAQATKGQSKKRLVNQITGGWSKQKDEATMGSKSDKRMKLPTIDKKLVRNESVSLAGSKAKREPFMSIGENQNAATVTAAAQIKDEKPQI